jgi:hypothetical protein
VISELSLGFLLVLASCTHAQISFVDADATNTQAVGGTPDPFSTTSITTDTLWRFRPGFGWVAGGANRSIYEKDASAAGAGDAAKLRTTISGLTPGQQYAIYVNWLSAVGDSWQIQAGLSSSPLTTFTPTSPGGSVENLGLSNESGSNRDQLRGFIGNAVANASGQVVVFIDDGAGTSSTSRTWYDAVSYGPPYVTPPPVPEPGT